MFALQARAMNWSGVHGIPGLMDSAAPHPDHWGHRAERGDYLRTRVRFLLPMCFQRKLPSPPSQLRMFLGWPGRTKQVPWQPPLNLAAEDQEIAQEVYDLTMEEVEQGWVRGPIPFKDLHSQSVLTRRFGVAQSSFDSEKGSVRKVRTSQHRFANLTSSSEETIAPHSVEVILAELVFRAKTARRAGLMLGCQNG